MLMKVKLCSEAKALFVEVCSFDGSNELCVAACVREGGDNVCLDFSFFVDVGNGDLDFMLFDGGSWSVEYVYGFEEKSWFPDVLHVSDLLVFNGLKLKFVKSD